jgi:hypothetical protein
MSNKPSRFRRKMRTETYTIPVDPNDVHAYRAEQERLREAHVALEAAQVDPKADRDKLQAEVTKARDALDAKIAASGVETMTFTFQALAPAKLEALRADHPPSPKQWEQHAAQKKRDETAEPPEFDPETYPAALIAATCIKVEWSDGTTQDGISEDEARELIDSSSTGDVAMFMAIIGGVNNAPSLVSDLGKDSGGNRGSAPSPTTAAPEGSQPSSS